MSKNLSSIISPPHTKLSHLEVPHIPARVDNETPCWTKDTSSTHVSIFTLYPPSPLTIITPELKCLVPLLLSMISRGVLKEDLNGLLSSLELFVSSFHIN